MSHIRRNVIRQTLLTGFVALSLTSIATAQTSSPTTGLGQAWPNAVDHSRSPYWHVYVFERDGIRYIQINDRNGTVHAALGRAGDTIFALPVGVDAEDVTISSSAEGNTSALPIYQDDAISVTASPQSDGAPQIMVLMCSDFGKCTGGSLAARAQ
jgi:hypothetical protein